MREVQHPLYSRVAELENDILRLQTLGDLLMALGAPRGEVGTDVVNIVGGYVHDTVASLKEDWNSIRMEMGGRP